MARRIAYKGRELPLTVQLSAALVAGGLLLAWIVAMVGADMRSHDHEREQHARELALCKDLASRAAPLLDRGDDLRLAVLAASTADLGKCRVLLLGRDGLVRLDTGLSLGGKELGTESADGPVQRELENGSFEVIAPRFCAFGEPPSRPIASPRVRHRLSSKRVQSVDFASFTTHWSSSTQSPRSGRKKLKRASSSSPSNYCDPSSSAAARHAAMVNEPGATP
ncbi:MAG: hypothetical protein ACYTG5_00910 [Planctomycetota bacterium]|jgi:hypothetical protein